MICSSKCHPPEREASRWVYYKWAYKIYLTRIGSGNAMISVTCHSLTLWTIIGLISLPPFIRLGWNYFCLHLWNNNVQFFLWQGPVPYAKKLWFVKLSQPFDKVLVWKFKLRAKHNKQNKKNLGRWLWAEGPTPTMLILFCSSFWH